MIDGIRILHPIPDLAEWESTYNLPLAKRVYEDGEIKAFRKSIPGLGTFESIRSDGAFDNYRCILTENRIYNHLDSRIGTCHVIVEGSVHRSHQNGTNFQSLSLSEARAQIELLCKRTGIDRNSAIQNIEIGVNIEPIFPAEEIICSLMHAKGRKFSDHGFEDFDGKRLRLMEYEIKSYSKGAQYAHRHLQVPQNLLRIEVKYRKMRATGKNGLRIVDDIFCYQKMETAVSKTLKRLNAIFMLDPALDENSFLNQEQQQFCNDAKLLKTWKNLWSDKNKNPYNRARRCYEELSIKHGSSFKTQFLDAVETQFKKMLQS